MSCLSRKERCSGTELKLKDLPPPANDNKDNQTQQPPPADDSKDNQTQTSPPANKDNQTQTLPPANKDNQTQTLPPANKGNQTQTPPPANKDNQTQTPPPANKDNQTQTPPPANKENQTQTPPPANKDNQTQTPPPANEDKDNQKKRPLPAIGGRGNPKQRPLPVIGGRDEWDLDRRSDVPCLSIIHREVMDLNHELLLDHVNPWELMLELASVGALSDVLRHEMNMLAFEGNRAVNRLLLAVLWKQGSYGYLSLVSALHRTGQRGLAFTLMKTEQQIEDLFAGFREQTADETTEAPESPTGPSVEPGAPVGGKRSPGSYMTLPPLTRMPSQARSQESIEDRKQIADLDWRLTLLEKAFLK